MNVEPIVTISFSSQDVMIEFTTFAVGCVGAITQRTRSSCVPRFLTLRGIMITTALHTHRAYCRFLNVHIVDILCTEYLLISWVSQ